MTQMPLELRDKLARNECLLPLNTWEGGANPKTFANWRWIGKDGHPVGIYDPVPACHETLWKALGRWERQPAPFLFLYGRPGVGKTHLALSIGWLHAGRVEHEKCVIFWQVQDMLEDLRTAFNSRGEGMPYGRKWDRLKSCDLLILDDIAAQQRRSDWANAVLDALVDHRYLHTLPTVFTSNTIGQEIPERVMDRCREGMVVRIYGESNRGKMREAK